MDAKASVINLPDALLLSSRLALMLNHMNLLGL